MTIAEWLGIGGFILGIINSAVHVYIHFFRKPKLDMEIIGPCQLVSNKKGTADLQVNIRLKAKHGPIFLRETTLQNGSINTSYLMAMSPPTMHPQYVSGAENGVKFSITHFFPLIDRELNAEKTDLLAVWPNNENDFIDIRDFKIEKDDVKSFTVLAKVFGRQETDYSNENVEVKNWELVISYDKQKVSIPITGSKLVTQYV